MRGKILIHEVNLRKLNQKIKQKAKSIICLFNHKSTAETIDERWRFRNYETIVVAPVQFSNKRNLTTTCES